MENSREMDTVIDCLPCLVRQGLDAVRECSADPRVQERLLRDVLSLLSSAELEQSPPAVAQRIQRRLRELTGIADPFRLQKERFDRMAKELLPGCSEQLRVAPDPFGLAVRLAIAGNVIDLGAKSGLTEAEARADVERAACAPLVGDLEALRRASNGAERILYLTDNAGEIFFDRLLVEQLPRGGRVTVAVRGAPVLNDATREDAVRAGLAELAEVIDNGSDAPGTLLPDCSEVFRERFRQADLIVGKGQGNYETLCEEAAPLFLLFRVKCPVVAAHVGAPVGAHVVARSKPMVVATNAVVD
jgi:uncharacterized protein with ATP-grasp and redox domains